MVKGFKDKDNKFHPTEKSHAGMSSKQVLRKNKANENVDNEKAKELQEKKIDREIDRFNRSITDFGSGDIASAVEKGDEIGLDGSEVADLAREFADDTGTNLSDIDPVAIVYEHELQMARNKIDSVLGFDIVNDADFYVAGNFLATTFDHSTESQEKLQEKINEASKDEKEELMEDIFVKVFFEDVGVDIQGK